MIKIRPITAQINTQKFISNFSSLLARAGMASAQSSPGRPPGPPAPCSSPEPAPPSPSGLWVRPFSPGTAPATPGVVQVPPLEREREREGGPLPPGAAAHVGLGRGPGEGWGGDGNFSRFFFFALLEPENSTEREVSHPHVADAPLEKRKDKRGRRGSPRGGTEFSWCLRVRSVQGNAAPLERDRVWKR